MKITLKRLSGLIHDSADALLVLDGNVLRGDGESLRNCLNDYVLRAEVVNIEADDGCLRIWLEDTGDEGSGDE